jgi:hypothetical protein
MNLHLTHDQLCDLILADPLFRLEGDSFESRSANDNEIVEAHLRACLVCSAELKSLRDSLSHFHDASLSYARQTFAQSYAQRSSIAPPQSFLSQPLYWVAAVVIFIAALFPLTIHRSHPGSRATATAASTSSRTTESDDALLADIDQKVSADVPSAMEPLADPTAGATSTTSTSDQRSN